ncbi:MAG: aldehyde dehydrogenase family protein, partial [Bacillota bacterium]
MEAVAVREAYGPFIDGAWQAGGGRPAAEVRNPATGELVARVALATVDDVDAALQAADRAFRQWRRAAPEE